MRYLNCSHVCRRALVTGVLLALPATPLFALKPPGNTAPVPAEPSKKTDEKSVPADVSHAKPVTPSSSERVQADSAVSFPVDI